MEDLAQKTEALRTSSAPGPPEGFDPNAVAHLARELGQVKSYFEGQISTLGPHMEALMAQLQEEHFRPRELTPRTEVITLTEQNRPCEDLSEGIPPNPQKVSEAGPSNPFMHQQRDQPDGSNYETQRSDGVSDHRVPPHDGMPPRGNLDRNANFRHCRGTDRRFFYDQGKFEPGAVEHFPQGKKLPRIKVIIRPLRGFVFSEAPTPSGPPLTPIPVHVYPGGGGIPWYGPGVYNTIATALPDPVALKDVQFRDVVPTWDGDGVKAQDWVLSYAAREQDMGGTLGEGKLIKPLLGAIRKEFADLIDKRVIRRNLSYAQVKEGVLRDFNRRVNRNVRDHVFHGLTVPKNCSVGELPNFTADCIYWGSQVREGVTFGHAPQRFLDPLVHHDGLTYKIYNKENTSRGLEFTYLTLYLFCEVELRHNNAVKRHQDHQKWRSSPLDKRPNVASLNIMGAEAMEDRVNATGESKALPNANDAQVF